MSEIRLNSPPLFCSTDIGDIYSTKSRLGVGEQGLPNGRCFHYFVIMISLCDLKLHYWYCHWFSCPGSAVPDSVVTAQYMEHISPWVCQQPWAGSPPAPVWWSTVHSGPHIPGPPPLPLGRNKSVMVSCHNVQFWYSLASTILTYIIHIWKLIINIKNASELSALGMNKDISQYEANIFTHTLIMLVGLNFFLEGIQVVLNVRHILCLGLHDWGRQHSMSLGRNKHKMVKLTKWQMAKQHG